MLNVKQGGIKYHLLSLWYDTTWDLTLVSRAIGEHSTQWVNKIMIKKEGNFKKETESLLLAAQNNVIKTNNIKAKIDQSQYYKKCKFGVDKGETINYIMKECSKIA